MVLCPPPEDKLQKVNIATFYRATKTGIILAVWLEAFMRANLKMLLVAALAAGALGFWLNSIVSKSDARALGASASAPLVSQSDFWTVYTRAHLEFPPVN
jgi:hypothetical protein